MFEQSNQQFKRKTTFNKLIIIFVFLILNASIASIINSSPAFAAQKCTAIGKYAQFCIDSAKGTCNIKTSKMPKKEAEKQKYATQIQQAMRQCTKYKDKLNQEKAKKNSEAAKKAEEAKKKAEEAKKKAEEAKNKNSTKSTNNGGTSTTTTTSSSSNICSDSAVPQSVKDAAGCNANDTLQSSLTSILSSIILIMGIVAVIFIIIGGVNYITSSGDSNKVKKAKDTILYSVIGLVICALAFVIVNFVIGSILKQGSNNDDEDDDAYIPALVQNDIAFLKK